MVGGGGDPRRTIRDFVILEVQGITLSIARPTIDANNFKLKPALILMVQQSQFSGSPLVDTNLHVSIFLAVPDMLSLMESPLM